jgi:hypothetical protein
LTPPLQSGEPSFGDLLEEELESGDIHNLAALITTTLMRRAEEQVKMSLEKPLITGVFGKPSSAVVF